MTLTSAEGVPTITGTGVGRNRGSINGRPLTLLPAGKDTHCAQLADRPRLVAERAQWLRGVSGNAFELCPERLPNGHLWRDWRPTRQDSVQELS